MSGYTYHKPALQRGIEGHAFVNTGQIAFTLRLFCGVSLAFCFVMLATGCTKGRKATEYSVVKGQVRYKGSPLPGGELAFHPAQGEGTAGTAVIDENGNYSINAPQGEVKITVDNEMIRTGGPRQHAASQKMGAGPRPGGPQPTEIKGKYVPLPAKYRSSETTDLRYTVTKGEQTKDIELTD
jgi:hypothetical protein